MLISRQSEVNPDLAPASIVGRVEQWQPGNLAPHRHLKHQLMYAAKGVVHVVTAMGEWVLPPTRAIWISGGTEHALTVKRPADTKVLYIDPMAYDAPIGKYCMVAEITPLVRELILTCAEFPWDYSDDSPQSRLSRVLIEQLQALNQAPVDLPLPFDPRALRMVEILRDEPANREPLGVLATRTGASARTIERLFAQETHMSFGAWRQRHRLITALEHLAHGESVTKVALEIGYESPSSFIVGFRTMFGTTPARYFQSA